MEPEVASSGVDQTFSQHGTGCINARRAASVVAMLTPILRLVAIRKRVGALLAWPVVTCTRVRDREA